MENQPNQSLRRKSKLFTALYIFLIILVVGMVVFLVSYLRSETTECVKNPVVYFEDKNEGASCTCFSADGRVYAFRPEDAKVVYNEPDYPEVNFSQYLP